MNPFYNLERVLRRLALGELKLRWFQKTRAPESEICKQKRFIEAFENVVEYGFGGASEELKTKIYLDTLSTEYNHTQLSAIKPKCEDCKHRFQYPDGTPFFDKDCSIHPERPEEIAMSDIAMCEHYVRIRGNYEDDRQEMHKKLNVILEFITEVQQKV